MTSGDTQRESQSEAKRSAEPSIGFLTLVLVRNLKLIAGILVVGLLLSILAQRMIVPRKYDAQATIVPYLANRGHGQSRSVPNIAGFNTSSFLTDSRLAISVANYSEILLSQNVLYQTLTDSIPFENSDRISEQRIIDILMAADSVRSNNTPSVRGTIPSYTAGAQIVEIVLLPRELDALHQLKGMITCSINDETSAMIIRVTAGSPLAASGICRRLLENFRSAIIAIYNAQMESNLDFLRDQIAVAGDQLRIAEDELVTFVENNVAGTSAGYRMRLDRQERRISTQQATYVNLLRQYDEVAFEQQKGTPAFYIIESIVVPLATEYKPRPLLVVAGGLILSAFFALATAFVFAAYLWIKEDPAIPMGSIDLDVTKRFRR